VQRKITISANVAGRDLVSTVNDVKQNIEQNITLPEGYRIEYGGQFQSAKAASRILFIASLLAICVIFLLLYGEFKNVSLAAIVMLNLPLALIGGLLAIFFTSDIVSIPSIIGFITLIGITTRNGILLISRYQHLENGKWRMENGELNAEKTNSQFSILNSQLRTLVLQGSTDRLNPILMTAISSALALVPLVLQGGKTGNEIQSPMGVVILGGLLTSTFLNIYIVPIVYEMMQKRKEQK
jgi:Cu/Ag efflux pump CusA